MERIKQAIENAKNTDSNGSREFDHGDQAVRHKKKSSTPRTHQDLRNTIKLVIAVLLIFFAGWLWLRLDFMNQLELIASEYINDGVKQARAEAKKRLADEENFKQLILNNLIHCQTAAENNKENYIKLVQDSVRVSNEKVAKDRDLTFIIPKATESKAEIMLEAAKAECQQIYNTQLQKGK